jgi:RHS repeat-associated protein
MSSTTPRIPSPLIGYTDHMLHLRARNYFPNLGTFLSLDPFEGTHSRPMSLNGYSYVEGNVPNWTDPSGMQTEIGAACAAFVLADGPFPVGDAACAILLAGVGAAALLNWIRVAQNFATAPGVGIPTRVATPNIYPDVNNPNEDPNGLPAEWTRIPPPSVTATATAPAPAPGNGLPDGAPTLLPGPFVPPFQDPMSTPAASPAPTATCTPTPPSTPTPSPTPEQDWVIRAGIAQPSNFKQVMHKLVYLDFRICMVFQFNQNPA